MVLENFIDRITQIENFVDGIMIVDNKFKIIYIKEYNNDIIPIEKKNVLGKSIFELYPNLNKKNSTIYQALKYGKSNIDTFNRVSCYTGESTIFVDSTFPIKQNNKIVGAVSIVNHAHSLDGIHIPNAINNSKDNNLYSLDDIIGESDEIKKLKEQIKKVSCTNSSVLIYGETGTGKELVAQSIHNHSKRCNSPFISQNCAAIPDTLFENIFFGSKKGSFTDAVNKPGIFESAHGGSIFLDEINSMSINMQAKLLKIIEDKKVTRIGDTVSKKVDVRIISATNEDPFICMKDKRIRDDVFYRLCNIQIYIPPLRHRKCDILPLTKHFINYFNKEMNNCIKGISDDVYDLFIKYSWPGNIRELKNAIEHAFIFANYDTIEIEDIPKHIRESCDSANSYLDYNSEYDNLKYAVENFEKNYILSRLTSTKNMTELANKLGITRQSLNNKLNKYSIKSKS